MTPTRNGQSSEASHDEDDGIPIPPRNFDEADNLTEAEFKRLRRSLDTSYRLVKREINRGLSNPVIPAAIFDSFIEKVRNAKRRDCHRLRQLKGEQVPHEEETRRFGDEMLRKRDSELIKDAARNNMKARELLYLRKLMRDSIKTYVAWEKECIRRWATLKVVQFLDMEAAIMFGGDMGGSLFAPCFWPSVDLESEHPPWQYSAGGREEDDVDDDGQLEKGEVEGGVRNGGVTAWECDECRKRGTLRRA